MIFLSKIRVATIDIGTNTVLLLVADYDPTTHVLTAVEEHATITRLGENVDQTRRLGEAAIARTTSCLRAYADVVHRLGVNRIDIVGTSAMRDAAGREPIDDFLNAAFGQSVRVISGHEEAELTFLGALSGLPDAPFLGSAGDTMVFDIGGGSTEVVVADTQTRHIRFARSFDIGSVRLTERHLKATAHGPLTTRERTAIDRECSDAFAAIAEPSSGTTVVGIAGTITTLAAISLGLATYDGSRVHGHELTTPELERVVDHLATLDATARASVVGLDPKRADVIVAGGLIAASFLRRIGARAIVVSDRGVRWGLAEKIARERRQAGSTSAE